MDPYAVWSGEGMGARIARAFLAPLGWGFTAGVALRNALFDVGLLRARSTAVPAISIGNLSVGGTGKTPVAADLARRLRDGGARPALVLRGYGGDEPAVHALLNPNVPVLTSADRVAASVQARAQGCDVVVLDDAFQHRWAARVEDVVLVAAEQWQASSRLLPAGPYREPRSALRRASLVVVTRKTASEPAAVRCAQAIADSVEVPVVRVAFHLDKLRRLDAPDEQRSLDALRGRRVLAVTGIGAPRAFAGQLEAVGAIVDLVSFPDHHRFSANDIARVGHRAADASCVVCTLKDAVKLAPVWPRALSPLWYVSQRLTFEAGESAYAACIRRMLDARSTRV